MSLDFYKTIQNPKRTEIKIEKSRFIASVAPVDSKELAESFLNNIRSEFYDASHNCFAFKIGADGLIYRSSDDGEPSGSAGKPILFAIQKSGYSDIVLVVTRYFGGTKLGVGGLARAYTESALSVLNLCEEKIIHLTIAKRVICTYEDISIVKRIVSEFAVSFSETYTDTIEIIVNLHQSQIDAFENKITQSTGARAGVLNVVEN